MADLTKCSNCGSRKLKAFFDVKATTGRRYKTCNTCRNRFKCTMCDAVHQSKGNLARHVKAVHDKIKDIKCTMCDYTCSQTGHLTTHVKQVHSNIKDHACTQCHFMSSSKGNLARHVKQVHDKIKDHACTQCHFMSSMKDTMTTHVKRVHDKIKDHACTMCDYKCSRKSDLEHHVKSVHSNIKDHSCTQCDYSCSRKSNLQQHVKICTGKLNISGGELAVRKALELLGFEYETEVSEVPNGKGRLRWDFKVDLFGCPAYIEYDGRQHYVPVKFGGMSMEKAQKALVKCQHHDELKNIWATDNSYALLRIPYTEFENIFELVRTFVSI